VVKVLVTGGAGYIGSTTAKALEQAGHTPVVLDSLLTGPRQFVRDRLFYDGDVGDLGLLERVLSDHPDIACTIHMAARVVVPESVTTPYEYYRDNVAKSLELFHALAVLGRPRVIFSSSASVYAAVEGFEVRETSPLEPPSPYARTKQMTEQVLADLATAGQLQSVVLRYFNPVGSDPDLDSGVHAREPSHVLGQLTAVALGRRDAFQLTGTRFPTPDGTGIRDYVHVWDVARAHVAAVERFDDVLAAEGAATSVVNLGTGRGVSVRELLTVFENVLGRPLPVVEAPPRPGDAVGSFANVDKARAVLGWTSELTVEEGVESALQWMAKRRQLLGYD
jgi:UDP-glucose 4-epimerase